MAPTPAPAPPSPVADAAPRPRNPDGTFAPATPEPGPTPTHSPRLRRMAEDCGLSEDEIAGATPAELEHAVYLLNRQLRAEHRQGALARTLETSRQPGESATVPGGTVAVASSPPAAPPAPPEFSLGLDESQYDPDLLGVLKRQGREIVELRAHVQNLLGREVVRENETTAERVDRVFDGWADEPRFGKGRGRELDHAGDSWGRRIAVLNEAQRLAGGAQAPLGKVLAKMGQARTNLFGAVGEAPRPAGATSPLPAPSPEGPLEAAWRQGGLAAPTNRSGAAEPEGRERAIQSVERWQRDNGVQREPEVLSEFPN